MNYIEKPNNKVYIYGEVLSKANFSHEVYGEGFYEMNVSVKRLSGQTDVLPVTISERLMEAKKLEIGSIICAIGQFRSYNKIIDGKSRLMLTVFVRELCDEEYPQNPNSIALSGYICKPPIYRTTPFSREIADLLIAVNRAYNKSDYIPCIAWGKIARDVSQLSVNDNVLVKGELHSREYKKKINDDEFEIRIAHELLVTEIKKL